MEISLSRYLIPIFCMGIVSIVMGCSSTIEIDERSPLSHVETIDKVGDDYIHTSELNQLEFTRVLLFSKNGMEIQVDTSLFQEQWNINTMTLEETKSIDFAQLYTVVVWDKQNQPYVLQVSDKGFKIGQTYYTNREGLQLHKWIQQKIGEKYLQTLRVGHLFIAALDLSASKKQVSEKGTAEMTKLLQSATLLAGEVRINTPLYPYYELYVESTTVGNIIITVLSPTLLSVKDGVDIWYYQLSDSIFSQAKAIIPIPFLSPHHVKHVFEADDIIINHELAVGQLLQIGDDPLKVKAMVHEVSRILSLGQARTKQSETIDTLKKEEQIHLEFLFSEGHSTPIIITEDFYIMNDTAYYLKEVANRIHNMIKMK